MGTEGSTRGSGVRIPLPVTPHFKVFPFFLPLEPSAAHFCCTVQMLQSFQRSPRPPITELQSPQTSCPKASSIAKVPSYFQDISLFLLISSPTPKICKPCYVTLVYQLECDCFVFWWMLERRVRQTRPGKLCNLREAILGKTVVFLAYKCCPMFKVCSSATFRCNKKTRSDISA